MKTAPEKSSGPLYPVAGTGLESACARYASMGSIAERGTST